MPRDESHSFDIEDLQDESDSSGAFIDLGLHHTESIDLKGMMQELDSQFEGGAEFQRFENTAFGKLMQALPIPALFIGPSRKIVFANLSCEKISVDYKLIEDEPFESLFPDKRSAHQVKDLVGKVFQTRKTQVLESILQIEDKKIWARVHLRSLWWGKDQSILVLVEDLTLEKTRLLLHKKLKKELENHVEQRTAELRKTNERLQQEIAERRQAEQELKKHRDHLEELVAERTAEVRESIGRLKREIMERKQMEKSLRSSEHRFNVAFRANPAAVDIATLDEGRYIEVNDSFCRLTGYSREEIIGRTAEELRHWAKAGHRGEMMSRLLKNGSVKDFETVFRSKGGRMIVASLSAEVIELDGKPHVLTIGTDITDRKRAEADRTRMITAFEQAAETIIIADEKGAIKYVNPAFEAACGYTRSEVQGKTINLFRSPDNEKGVIESAKQKLARGEVWRGRLVNRKKDGTLFEVETSISPVKSKTGHPINFVIVERDVTDVARHERQIRQAEKLEAIGTLATGIADDFNNIVMAMIGYAEMAERSVFDNAAVREELDHILLAGRRGTDLVKQILTFSRRDEQEKYPVDVHRVFKEALTLIRASTPSTIEIRQNIDVSTGPVMADPTQMHQVLMNLCANACEAMEGSDGVLEVTVRDDVLSEGSPDLGHSDLTPGRYVKLTVSDTGSGIPPELLDRIFDPYFTTREAGKKTGLGLSVVLGIVQSHGGAVTVNSRPGRGTTVDVYLPHCEATADSVHVEGHERESGTEWIIFVDDEEQLSEFGGRTLESLGYRVTALTDPLKAVEIARENPQEIDLVITDLMMPNMTGVELAGSLMQISPGLPILLCTGFEEALSRKKVREMGFVDLLMKPVATSVLEEVVPKVLSAKRARKAR